MQVAVVTPYHREPLDLIERCVRSVAAQTLACRHVVVADGFPRQDVDSWPVDHLTLPRSHADFGSTPRLIGCFHAIGLGCDAIAFLDADNWYQPDHVESLVQLHLLSGAAFVSSRRRLVSLDGSDMGGCPITDPERFIDTNCMMFLRPAFGLLSWWGLMPRYAHPIGDRIMLHHVRTSGVAQAHSGRETVNYTCGKAGLYRLTGRPAPAGVTPGADYAAAHAQWLAAGLPPIL